MFVKKNRQEVGIVKTSRSPPRVHSLTPPAREQERKFKLTRDTRVSGSSDKRNEWEDSRLQDIHKRFKKRQHILVLFNFGVG